MEAITGGQLADNETLALDRLKIKALSDASQPNSTFRSKHADHPSPACPLQSLQAHLALDKSHPCNGPVKRLRMRTISSQSEAPAIALRFCSWIAPFSRMIGIFYLDSFRSLAASSAASDGNSQEHPLSCGASYSASSRAHLFERILRKGQGGRQQLRATRSARLRQFAAILESDIGGISH